jgi:hypothetical protein
MHVRDIDYYIRGILAGRWPHTGLSRSQIYQRVTMLRVGVTVEEVAYRLQVHRKAGRIKSGRKGLWTLDYTVAAPPKRIWETNS